MTSERITLLVDGRERTATVVVPNAPTATRPPAATRPLAAVLVFHASGQSGDLFRGLTHGTFDVVAERGEAVVVYLDGFEGHWNDARRGIAFSTRIEGVDDTAFALAVVDMLVGKRHVHPDRIFAVGFSNGAQMVVRLAHEIPERLAGIALIAAGQPEPDNFAPSRDAVRPLPTIVVHGTRDTIAPYEGGEPTHAGFVSRGPALSAEATAGYFARRNGITTPPTVVTEAMPNAKRPVVRTHHRQDARPPVTLVTLVGRGHVVSTPPSPFVAADEILGFFGLADADADADADAGAADAAGAAGAAGAADRPPIAAR